MSSAEMPICRKQTIKSNSKIFPSVMRDRCSPDGDKFRMIILSAAAAAATVERVYKPICSFSLLHG